MKPLVSILIPVYNRGDLVSEAIESAINQTYKNLEIIIVDNHSTDNTWQVLQFFETLDNRIRIFRNDENIGPVYNWEKCINEAKGEYSKFLFSDDLISKNYIEETLKLFDENVAFTLSNVEVFREEKSNKVTCYRNSKEFTTEEYLDNVLLFNYCRFPVSPGAALFRTTDLIKSLEIEIENTYDLEYKLYGAGNDILLYLNIVKNYKYVSIANRATAYFRAHKKSFSISNNLGNYYGYAKLHYIKKNKIDILGKFKLIAMYKYLTKKNIIDLYKLIEDPIDWIYLFTIIKNTGLLKVVQKVMQKISKEYLS